MVARGALGGGFGGCENKDWECVEADSRDDAMNQAEQLARDEYESYEGMHGIRCVDDITQEDDLTAEEAEQVYQEEIESWIGYEATDKNPEEVV